MRNDNDDDYTVYEDTGIDNVSTAPSDEQIKAFVEANINNPALIAETAAQYGVSVADLSRVTGYGQDAVVNYFQQADVAPPAYEPPSKGGLNTVAETPAKEVVQPPRQEVSENYEEPQKPIYEPPRPPIKDIVEPPRRLEEPPTKEIVEWNAPVDLGDGTFRTPSGTIIDKDGRPVTKTADTTTATTTANTDTSKTSTLPTVTDLDGHQYDGSQLLTLAQQISQNVGSMSGGVFNTKGEKIGFDSSEANKLLGRPATAAEQVLLDMSRNLIQNGVTDLSQLKVGDVKNTGNVTESIDEDGNKKYFVTYGGGDESIIRELTKDEVAKIKTEEVMGDENQGPYVRKTIEDFVTGKGLFANGKKLEDISSDKDPISYQIGRTFTGKGGTNYELKFDPTTGKSIINSSGFSTSDAGAIMPIIMIASNFLLPGVGTALTSTLAEAGLGELASQVVSKAVINGVTSGIMAEASGGKFGDGFLKGAVTGAISAGVAPTISTALPSDLPPAVSSALTKAGTAAVTALATGKDVGTAIGTQLLNSAVGTGLGAVTGEIGLSTSDAKLLNSVLTPVVTQLVTNGNVSDATLMNAVMLAGSTVLANAGSDAVSKVTDLTTSDGTKATDDTTGGGLNLLARDTANAVGTGLSTAATATGLVNKLTSSTNVTDNKAIKTKANLTGALKTTKPTTTAVKPAALGALNTAKKTMTAQQISQLKASKPPAQVNVANLTPVKKPAPPQKVDVKTLIPVKTAQLPAGLNTKKMG